MKLRAEHIEKSYGKRTVVNQISFEVDQGEIIGLLGPNGAGKTTSFYMVVGLVKPDGGKVFLGEEEITNLAMYKRAQRGLGYLPQEASVFRNLSVEDNIKAILEFTPLSKQEQKQRLEELLDEFGLKQVRKSMGNVLSGGERRRTEIARGLATSPSYILLDEPFAGIDPIAVEDIQRIILKLKEKNIGVLITDHNVQETLSITDRAYLLFEGNILKTGTAEELAEDEQVRKLYLGKSFVLKRKNFDEDDEIAFNIDLSLRQIKDIQAQANALLQKDSNASIEKVREFSNFNNELIAYLKQNITDGVLLKAIQNIDVIELEKVGNNKGDMLKKIVLAGALTKLLEYREIEKLLQDVRSIKDRYTSLEILLKTKYEK